MPSAWVMDCFQDISRRRRSQRHRSHSSRDVSRMQEMIERRGHATITLTRVGGDSRSCVAPV
jgi:hypothetical protein